jgi:hypothetical protein
LLGCFEKRQKLGVGELLPGAVRHDEAHSNFLDGPRLVGGFFFLRTKRAARLLSTGSSALSAGDFAYRGQWKVVSRVFRTFGLG